MKAKVKRGNGFRGTLNYVLDEGKKRTGDKDALIIGGNMSFNNAKNLAREFRFSRELRTDVKNPVWHCSLALPKGDTIDVGTWDRLSNRFLEEMDVDTSKHQFVVVKHHDTDNEHVHIVMSRIGLDGQLWHGRNDVMHAIESTQTLEKEFGLTLTAGYFKLDANGNKIKRAIGKKGPKPQETQMSARTGEAPKKLVLQQIIDEATTGEINVFNFIEQLECAGVTVRPNVAKTGRLNGFSFEYEGIPFKGSDLGDDYKWSKKSKLKQNVTYEQTTESERLIATAERIKQRASKPSQEAPEFEAAGQSTHKKNYDADRSEHDGVSGEIPSKHNGVAAIATTDATTDRGEQKQVFSSNNERSESITELNNEGVQPVSGGDSKFARNPALDKLENEVNDLRGRARNWNAVNNTVADLAAPIVANIGTDKQSPDQLKKVNAWREQHQALNAEQYRITLIPRKANASPWVLGKKAGQETFFTPNEVEAKIPLMRQKNAQGYDVYITPMDAGNHYIVVDDLTTAEHMKMSKEGYKPTLVQESSKDNRQAIFKIPKQGDPEEQTAANAVVVELNRKHGDKNFSGVVHPFRMAGFRNKKAGRNNAFTLILSTSKALCTNVLDKLKQAVGMLVARRDETNLKHSTATKRREEQGRPPEGGKEAKSQTLSPSIYRVR